MIRIGCYSITANPLEGVYMAGFAPLRSYKEKHSDLWIKAVLIEDNVRTLFLTIDTIAIDGYFYQELCKRLQNFSIKKERIFASASHTHSGGVGLVNTEEGILKGTDGLFGSYDRNLVEETLNRIEEVVEKASENFEEVVGVRFGNGELKGVGTERHDPSLPGDNRLFAWSFKTVSNKEILFYNFACHPTILNGTDPYLSSDYPGAVANILSSKYDMICFLNGSCGDISTRFTRSGDKFEQINIFAKLIASKIEEVLRNANYEEIYDLDVLQKVYRLKTRDFGDEETALMTFKEAEKRVKEAKNLSKGEKRVVESFMEGARTNLAFAKNFKDFKEVELLVSFIAINDRIMITIPAELFSALSNELREDFGFVFLGYTNGYCLYIADELAYDKGYYEALSSIYEKGQGELLMEAIKKDVTSWIDERKELL